MPGLGLVKCLRRWGRMGHHRRMLLIEAVICLLFARIALVIVPFSRLARGFGEFVPPDLEASHESSGGLSDSAKLAGEISWAVRRAASYLPLEMVCLPQAMAARYMLDRRGVVSVMHFGAAKGQQKPIETHAWLDAAGVEVTGYPLAKTFTEIGRFI